MENKEYIDFIKLRLQQKENVLALKQQQIKALLQVSEAINQNMPAEALFKIYEYVLRSSLGVEKFALYVLDHKWKVMSCFNVPAHEFGLDLDTVPYSREIRNISELDPPYFTHFSNVLTLTHKGKIICYLLIGDLETQDDETLEEKLDFIKTITTIMVVSNENRRLDQEQIKKHIQDRELALASEVQRMLIPQNPPSNSKIQTSVTYMPHTDVGGDFYDVIELSDDEVALVMCDVSGKGIAAGMLMANFQATLRTIIHKDLPLESLVEQLNVRLYEITKGEKHITMFLAIYHTGTRNLKYVCAGHCPAILYDNGVIKELADGCLILGTFDSLPWVKIGEVTVGTNAVFFSYTDGLIEFESEDKVTEVSIDVLSDLIIETASMQASEINYTILDRIDQMKGDLPFRDDISMLTVKFL